MAALSCSCLCAVTGREYTIYGYNGKQVRDQIHSRDVARLFVEFYKNPRAGEVYNLGGGRQNGLFDPGNDRYYVEMGYPLRYRYDPANRVGDHICYISDLRKIHAHFPEWNMEYDLRSIISEITLRHLRLTAAA